MSPDTHDNRHLAETPAEWKNVRQVFGVRLDNLGDVVMTGPALRTLRHALSDAEITMMVTPLGSRIAPPCFHGWIASWCTGLPGRMPQEQCRSIPLGSGTGFGASGPSAMVRRFHSRIEFSTLLARLPFLLSDGRWPPSWSPSIVGPLRRGTWGGGPRGARSSRLRMMIACRCQTGWRSSAKTSSTPCSTKTSDTVRLHTTQRSVALLRHRRNVARRRRSSRCRAGSPGTDRPDRLDRIDGLVLSCLHRLHGTSQELRHIAEMVVTSVLIPPLAIYWRLRGALTYRTWFF